MYMCILLFFKFKSGKEASWDEDALRGDYDATSWDEYAPTRDDYDATSWDEYAPY